MKSPITGKEAKLIRELGEYSYRKENFSIINHYFYCKESGERFTTSELDTINLVQVHNQYRERYGIPFPEEIRNIREKYQVSALKMSEILGLGTNTYRLYETGEMPSVANGRLILSVKHPVEFSRQVDASAHLLTARELERIKEHVRQIQLREQAGYWDKVFEQKIFTRQSPDEYTGYREPQLEKIAHVITYFGSHMKLFKTKLNKLFFYSDFCYYQKTGYSITGLSYRAIPFGPVPSEYDKLYIKLCDDNQIIITEFSFDNDHYAELINPCLDFNKSLFSDIELRVLEAVATEFKNRNTKEIVDISHKEPAWKENHKEKQMISYQKHGFSIHNFS
ncbi:MAG TPA: type II toxin-antitoxin system antitoxin SocA domain-containing protein, partial [Mucilaginibacter sp.]|nr:type II toxin-antitoxin system antitoxin SocA domain-containing protein [Mucilaginibacter sp.]